MPLSKCTLAVFNAAKKKSDEGLLDMRKKAASMFGKDTTIVVGANGSYARREVTSGSDVDLFLLYRVRTKEYAQKCQERLRRELKLSGYAMPAENGVFDDPLSISTLQRRIGGMEDNNVQITRRMLLLLEGEWIFNKEGFDEIRTRILKNYVSTSLREDQICLFLLNDVIRYWRTICVDFEFKVRNDSKAREVRLVKLRFSRLLLFVAGVLAVGETYRQSAEMKLKILDNLLKLPATDRIQKISGESAVPALNLYAKFLVALDDDRVREALTQESRDGEQSEEFEDLRAKAQEFRNALLTLLKTHLHKQNPTLNALLL